MVMEPWTDDLIGAAGCKDGDRVLDVACGTGSDRSGHRGFLLDH